MLKIITARVYDDDQPDGYRVLIDRLWPRGVKKEALELDEWARDVTPTDELRKAFHAGDLDFDAFSERLQHQLAESGAAADLYQRADKRRALVLLTAAKDVENSHVPVIADAVRDCDNES